jgi:hypothetical protein
LPALTRDLQDTSDIGKLKSDWILRTEAAFKRFAADQPELSATEGDDISAIVEKQSVDKSAEKQEIASQVKETIAADFKPKASEYENAADSIVTAIPEFRIVSAAAADPDEFGPKLKYVWRDHRSAIYLGLSALILLLAILSLALPSLNRNSVQRRSPLVEDLMVSTGLAKSRPQPSYSGNPDVQVWADVQNGRYYCPGTGEYGRSKGGTFTSQRDAQGRHLEPAYRRACP